MAFASATQNPLLGNFEEEDMGNIFEYEMADDYQEFVIRGKRCEFPHLVWVTSPWKMDCGYRRALVKKTVAYIVVDESDNGPVIEKWKVKKHNYYLSSIDAVTPGQQLLERLAS